MTSPNYGLAEQVRDPWGGGCTSLSGPGNAADRRWFAQHGVAVFAYSVLARGFFSGKFTSDEPERARALLEPAAVTGYCCEANFERLRRCELLAREKGVSVARIAMAWFFNQEQPGLFALTSPTSRKNIHESVLASEMALTKEECRWLDLETDAAPV